MANRCSLRSIADRILFVACTELLKLQACLQNCLHQPASSKGSGSFDEQDTDSAKCSLVKTHSSAGTHPSAKGRSLRRRLGSASLVDLLGRSWSIARFSNLLFAKRLAVLLLSPCQTIPCNLLVPMKQNKSSAPSQIETVASMDS